MKILWFTWKDREHPQTGGAETVNEELAKRLAASGHEVIFLVGGFPGGAAEETRDGLKIIRVGRRYSVYYQAYRYYKKNLVGWADLVIDEVNTIPFFCKFYVREQNIILNYQLCREIWFYQMWFPASLIGYALEPLYLWLLRDRTVLTESASTKKDLLKYGFQSEKIKVFRVGLDANPISEEELTSQKKEADPTILYVGSIRSMKRPDQLLPAFAILKKTINNAKLFIVGSGDSKYAQNFFKQVADSPYQPDITCFGRVADQQKLAIMRRAQLIAVTSVKEGWGLIITEANSQGTPAVAYDIDGLRDACKNNYTGLITTKNNPSDLAEKMTQLLQDKDLYAQLRLNAWRDSLTYSYDSSYKIFISLIQDIYKKL